MSRRFPWLAFLAFVVALHCPAWATWSVVQHVFSNSNCTTTGCSLTISAPSSGNLLIIAGGSTNSSDTYTFSDSASDAYTVPAGCAGGDSASFYTACAYLLGPSSGPTSVTISRTQTGPLRMQFWELHSTACTGAACLLDQAGFRDQSTSTSTPAGVTLSVSASKNDAVLQWFHGATTLSSITSPGCGTYTLDSTAGTTWGYARLLNVVNCGSPLTWNLGSTGRAVVAALAFSEPATASCQPSAGLLGVASC